MLFGLCGAPATLQRLMDHILTPHMAYAALCMDNIVIYSQSWDQHIQHLRAILKELRYIGMTANPKKCALGVAEAKYLGFRVGQGVI